MPSPSAETIYTRYRQACARRSLWESHWQEAYDYALPQRDAFTRAPRPGEKKTDKLFDGTAPDAVDQLAASLLAQLTPPWARWFGLTAGTDIFEEEEAAIAGLLDQTAETLQSHLDRSNFAVEMHQGFLDLVTGGTACLLFEEAAPGAPSAFRFTAVPLSQAVLDEGPTGELDTTYRRSTLDADAIRVRFPKAPLPEWVKSEGTPDSPRRFTVIEAVVPDGVRYTYHALLENEQAATAKPWVLASGDFDSSPFLNFRWLKAPGEIYGRSPVMKALPDIKTANKVVELVLKNATIAVTGIWQADDDGVLNPANIKLVPGTIIPKAVGSSGLTPLEAPGRFDVSQIVLDDLRSRIRKALLVDQLGQADGPRMTATEVLERAAEMTRILGATYGRLQSELLTPLVSRGLQILRRRGEIPDIFLDGRLVDLQYRSPLAQSQVQKDVQLTLTWLNAAASFGPEGTAAVDLPAAVRWMGRKLGVPNQLIREEPTAALADMAQAVEEVLAAEAAPGETNHG
ncbi:MAG: head-tail connector protein [Alphaproteobacteria bacterium]|nr:head-tail connector protein [Alphaproteobacteria bacterium]